MSGRKADIQVLSLRDVWAGNIHLSTTSSIEMVFKAMELEEKKGPRQKKQEWEPGTGDGGTPTSTGLRVGEELQRHQTE